MADRNLTDVQLRSVADQLIGQCCKGIEEVCEEDGLPLYPQEWTTADCAAFDELAFLCARCEWWVSGDDHGSETAEEEENNFVCGECGPEEG